MNRQISLTFACAVKRRWSTAVIISPGNWFAPPGSNLSSPKDVDGDGKTDIVLYNSTIGTVANYEPRATIKNW